MTQKKHLKINQVFSDLEVQITADIDSSQFKETFECLFNKTKSIDLIAQGILSCSNNLYATQILHRSLIEHLMVNIFVFLRWRLEKSNSVGQEYYSEYAKSEFFKQEMYFLRLEDLANGTNASNLEKLKEIYPDIDFNQADLEEYHRIANRFADVKKIGEFLIKNKNVEPFLENFSVALFNQLGKYNLLSSHVHGGPFAERAIISKTEPDHYLLNSEIDDLAYISTSISKTALISALSTEHEKYKTFMKEIFR